MRLWCNWLVVVQGEEGRMYRGMVCCERAAEGACGLLVGIFQKARLGCVAEREVVVQVQGSDGIVLRLCGCAKFGFLCSTVTL